MNPPETHDTPADNPADNPAAAPVPEGEAETATDDEYSTASTGQPKRSDRASNAIWLFKWFVVEKGCTSNPSATSPEIGRAHV